MSRFPRSLAAFHERFPDDAACIDYLEKHRWPRGFKCPHCDRRGDPYRFSDQSTVIRCRGCKRDISILKGTIMERTHLSVFTWFTAAYLWASEGWIGAADLQGRLRLKRYATAHSISAKLAGGTADLPLSVRQSWRAFRWTLGLRLMAFLILSLALFAASYDRPSWRDDDHDCQDTRQEVIISSCEVTLAPSGCKVVTAVCVDPYSGAELSTDTPAQSIQIDHLFPSGEAWKRRKWTPAAFADFYNDQRNLLATRSRYNGQKSDKMPHEWCPVNSAIRPLLAKKLRRIARDYGLPLTPAEEVGLRAWEVGRCAAGALLIGKNDKGSPIFPTGGSDGPPNL